MSDLTPKEYSALDIAMTRLGQLVDRMEKASHPYPRERTWPDCEAELAQLRAEIEQLRQLAELREKQLDTHIAALIKNETEIARLREALRPMTQGLYWITYEDIDKAREALGDE